MPRKIRHQRVRKHVFGTPERPRLAVFRSNRHVVAQVIDDVAGHTLAAASTMELAGQEVEGAKIGAAHQVGLLVAERAQGQGHRTRLSLTVVVTSTTAALRL